jgi:hypothetical protein
MASSSSQSVHAEPTSTRTFGIMPQFSVESADEWSIFEEQLEFYFTANQIDSANLKKAILFSNAGPTVYRQVRKLCQPQSTSDISYDEAIELLRAHYNPTSNIWLSRTKFDRRVQRTSEPFKDFVADLRLLAQPCKFDDVDQALLQRIVVCMNNVQLQELIFTTKFEQVTLAWVCQKALAAEAARQDVASLNSPSNSVYRMHTTAHKTSVKSPCHSCGELHRHDTCRFKTYVCNYCKAVGHLAKVCRKKQRQYSGASGPSPVSSQGGRKSSVHKMSTTTPVAYNEMLYRKPNRGRSFAIFQIFLHENIQNKQKL